MLKSLMEQESQQGAQISFDTILFYCTIGLDQECIVLLDVDRFRKVWSTVLLKMIKVARLASLGVR